MSKILLYGGVFDPPHLAHVELVHRAMKHLSFDQVMYIPVHQSPLKARPFSSNEHRLAMLELALADESWATVSTIEIDRGGTSFMIETLESLQNDEDEFRLLIGADQWSQFYAWYRWEDIQSLADPVVMPRKGFASDNDRILPITPLSSSSSDIREIVKLGKPIKQLVHPKVAAYIAQHKLYL